MNLSQRLKQRSDLKQLESSLRTAPDLKTWRELGLEHDKLSGAERWKQREDGQLFDISQIRTRHNKLRALLLAGDSEELLFALNEGLHGNMGGMGSPALYKHSKRGTKEIIDDYVATIKQALNHVMEAPEEDIHFDEKLDFFRRASHCYGRSALCMSGGGGLIYYHHGVVETLLEQGLLPNVLSGASAGAWMCAQIGTRTDSELRDYFSNHRYPVDGDMLAEEFFDIIRGNLPGIVERERDKACEDMIADMTFQEAFEHTGRCINISIAPYEKYQTSRLMNAVASPNVTIRSAIRASASIPGVSEPVALEAKDSRGRTKPYLRDRRWVDGSMSEDLPFKRLARMYGVNHFIVSMINPMALPFIGPDPSTRPDSIAKSIRKVSFQTVKESIKTVRRITPKIVAGRADTILSTAYKLMDQHYAGDINFILRMSQIKPRYAIFQFENDEEVRELIDAGRRATWPRLDQIQNSTSVSQLIDGSLAKLEADAVSKFLSKA